MNRLQESSAGGLVYRKTAGGPEVLLLQWKNARGELTWVLPKGHIEPGEHMRDTALREISEECGLPAAQLETVKFIKKINYSFVASYREGSPVVDKEVFLFLVRYVGTANPVPQKEENFLGYRWFTLEALKGAQGVKPDLAAVAQDNTAFMM